ncbi:hypothetical protein L1N85_15270 [Paenibacillus alkaliterrae]|uniref:hypothetical protein n=1 Tax=Paenibacillus alkaliterrae TaxID=320909 RepID=UPI001F3B6D17|nr:hypothetical protein [Paenibacillus alkaliterrae]MCF2939780.1 hypothetical protein [Paenibacillus alkaliterrae]
MDTLETIPKACLYDTAAISKHELVFFRNGLQLHREFVGTHPIIITNTILDELRFYEDTEERYAGYLKQFEKIILIDETTFVKYFYEMYSPKQRSLTKYKGCAIRSFRTIHPLAEAIHNTHSEQAENRIIDLFNTYFSSGKNKGEYSLLWLSNMLRDVFPRLAITFIGIDRDLFHIVDYEIRILSNDSILQALLRRYRNVP